MGLEINEDEKGDCDDMIITIIFTQNSALLLFVPSKLAILSEKISQYRHQRHNILSHNILSRRHNILSEKITHRHQPHNICPSALDWQQL